MEALGLHLNSLTLVPFLYRQCLPYVLLPTLILVGDSDGEVPMEQSVEWWHALATMKVPTELVVYPHEGHMLGKPADSRDYTVRTLEWFEEWFGKAGTTH